MMNWTLKCLRDIINLCCELYTDVCWYYFTKMKVRPLHSYVPISHQLRVIKKGSHGALL